MKLARENLATMPPDLANQLIGSSVTNDKNEKIGTVDDLITDSKKQLGFAVLQVGGFLGVGAHLVMVPNPPFHPKGDFALNDGTLALEGEPRFTFGNIGLYDTRMFDDLAPGTRRALTPWRR